MTLNLVKAGEAEKPKCQDPMTLSLLPDIVVSTNFILALFITLTCKIKYKSSHQQPEPSWEKDLLGVGWRKAGVSKSSRTSPEGFWCLALTGQC